MFTRSLIEDNQDKTAVINDVGDSFTYSDIWTIACDINKSLKKGGLVFCLCQNTVESISGYISFLSNNVVPLLLDSEIDTDLLNNLIKIYKPDYIWLPSARFSDFQCCQVIYTFQNYKLLEFKKVQKYDIYLNLALLLTTSGSTGSPKLVRLSKQNILSNATSIAKYLSITSDERPITVLPMNYSFGLSIINSHLLKGATILLTTKSIMEKEFWQFLKAEKATSFSGVPYTYEILKKLRFFRMDLPFLKTMTQAGGKLNIEINQEFAEYCQTTGKRFFVMYGQTEATARMSYLPDENKQNKLGSIGIAIPDGQFELITENGSIINESEIVGELVYKGDNVSLGYAECVEDLAKGDENFGVLKTGDLAKRDIDNYYYIVGRKKRFIKVFGNRINLDETESLLKNIVLDCACTGVDDKLIVYTTEKERISEIKSFLTLKIGINQSALEVKFINSIPKNSSGKTIYSNLEI